MPYRQLLRECAILLALAAVLGFGYTFLSKRGYFASTPASIDQSRLTVVTLSSAKAAFESGSSIFIDARHEFEFAEGHIRGAINIPLMHLDQHTYLFDQLQKEKSMIIYCDGVACNSSIEVAAKLIERGYVHVAVFYGGWQEWTEAGLPVDSSQAAPHHSLP